MFMSSLQLHWTLVLFSHSRLQALADLTGGIAMNISIKKMQADVRSGSLWKKLLEYRDAGYLMGCGACECPSYLSRIFLALCFCLTSAGDSIR